MICSESFTIFTSIQRPLAKLELRETLPSARTSDTLRHTNSTEYWNDLRVDYLIYSSRLFFFFFLLVSVCFWQLKADNHSLGSVKRRKKSFKNISSAFCFVFHVIVQSLSNLASALCSQAIDKRTSWWLQVMIGWWERSMLRRDKFQEDIWKVKFKGLGGQLVNIMNFPSNGTHRKTTKL